MIRTCFTFAFVLIATLGAIHQALAMCAGCDVSHFTEQLAAAEGATTSCVGGGSYYTCQGPQLPASSSHAGDRPMGLYQFMPNTALARGCIPDKSEASIQAFLNDPAAQDACAAAEMDAIYNHIASKGYGSGGGGYDCGALIAAGWLGGPGGAVKVAEGGSTSDQVYSGYSTSDRASQFNGVCSGGSVAAGTIVRGSGDVIGCDPAVHEFTKQQQQAAMSKVNAAVDTIVERPVDISTYTCADDLRANRQDISNIQSSSGAFGLSALTSLNISSLSFSDMSFSSIGGLTGGIRDGFNAINATADAISERVDALNRTLSDPVGTIASAFGADDGCGNMDEFWRLVQCAKVDTGFSLGFDFNLNVGDLLCEAIGVVSSGNDPFEYLKNNAITGGLNASASGGGGEPISVGF